jgi:hypothetical protein
MSIYYITPVTVGSVSQAYVDQQDMADKLYADLLTSGIQGLPLGEYKATLVHDGTDWVSTISGNFSAEQANFSGLVSASTLNSDAIYIQNPGITKGISADMEMLLVTDTDSNRISLITASGITVRPYGSGGYVEIEQDQITLTDMTNYFYFTPSGIIFPDQTSLTTASFSDGIQYFLVDATRPLAGDLLPEMTGASGVVSSRNIGSPTQKFNTLYVHDLRADAGSIYVNDKKVIEDESDTITIKTDPDQDLAIKTTGVGDINLLSEHTVLAQGLAGLEFVVPSDQNAKDIEFSTTSKFGSISLTAGGQFGNLYILSYNAVDVIAEDFIMDSNLTVTGTLDVVGGLRISSQAPTGYYLRGDGSCYISSIISDGDLPATVIRASQLATASGDIVSQIPTTTAGLADSVDKRYITDAELTILSTTSGAIVQTAISPPATPQVDTSVRYITAIGVSPNRVVSVNEKLPDGSVVVIATCIV